MRTGQDDEVSLGEQTLTKDLIGYSEWLDGNDGWAIGRIVLLKWYSWLAIGIYKDIHNRTWGMFSSLINLPLANMSKVCLELMLLERSDGQSPLCARQISRTTHLSVYLLTVPCCKAYLASYIKRKFLDLDSSDKALRRKRSVTALYLMVSW